MSSVRVAIVGVGNCAASLVQGVEYYKDADPNSRVPGLMHVQFGEYHVRDVEFVAAFDVDAKKVGLDLADAIGASENNTIKICDVPTTGIQVLRGPTNDGLGKYYRETIEESSDAPVDIVKILKDRQVDVLRVGLIDHRADQFEVGLDIPDRAVELGQGYAHRGGGADRCGVSPVNSPVGTIRALRVRVHQLAILQEAMSR